MCLMRSVKRLSRSTCLLDAASNLSWQNQHMDSNGKFPPRCSETCRIQSFTSSISKRCIQGPCWRNSQKRFDASGIGSRGRWARAIARIEGASETLVLPRLAGPLPKTVDNIVRPLNEVEDGAMLCTDRSLLCSDSIKLSG